MKRFVKKLSRIISIKITILKSISYQFVFFKKTNEFKY